MILGFYIFSSTSAFFFNYKIVVGLKNFVAKKMALISPTQNNFLKQKKSVNNQKRITIIIITTTSINLSIRLFHFVTLLIFKIICFERRNIFTSLNFMERNRLFITLDKLCDKSYHLSFI